MRQVGAAYGLSKSSIDRHRKTCMPPKIARAAALREDELSTSTLLDEMLKLQKTTQLLLDESIAMRDTAAASKLVREVRENVALMGRFLGAFAGENAKNVDNSVKILALQSLSVDDLRGLAANLRSGLSHAR